MTSGSAQQQANYWASSAVPDLEKMRRLFDDTLSPFVDQAPSKVIGLNKFFEPVSKHGNAFLNLITPYVQRGSEVVQKVRQLQKEGDQRFQEAQALQSQIEKFDAVQFIKGNLKEFGDDMKDEIIKAGKMFAADILLSNVGL